MIYGSLIKSIMGDGECKCLHVGLDDPSFIASVKKKIGSATFYVAESDDEDTLPWVNLVGGITGDIGSDYDLFVVPACEKMFSTSIYVALEGALKDGGFLAIYGSKGEMESRSSLLVSMVKEGSIAPYSLHSFRSDETIIFQMSDGILVRNM